LDLYCEEVEDPGTLAALVTAKERGVTVRFIAAVLSGSGKVNGNARGITYLKSAGVNAVCKTFLYIHAKMVLADAGQAGSSAYLGSENFSCTSLNHNRECGIIFPDPDLLTRLQTVFNADWAQPSVTVVPDETPLQPCS
jgi:phosphatidylserine/phosphatidylglycerophosphate/cardiolipin synthase-like enzyme